MKCEVKIVLLSGPRVLRHPLPGKMAFIGDENAKCGLERPPSTFPSHTGRWMK